MPHILHEDVLNEEASIKLINWAKKSNLFNEIKADNPPLTQGKSLHWLLSKVNTDYCFNIEDDWEIIQRINLDKLLELMESNKDINQIAFHKRKIMSYRYKFKKIEIERNNIKLTTNPHWAFTPAIGRMSFIRQYWQEPPAGENPVWFINPLIKRSKKMRSAEWMIKNVGAYFLGGIGEGHYVNHLGTDGSVRTGTYTWNS